MILRTLSLFCFFLVLMGCSSAKTPISYGVLPAEAGNDTSTLEPSATPRKKAVVDASKPANFNEYRQWRQVNDPSGQTYAEYKQWEAAYRQWSKQQQTEVAR